MAYWGLAKLSQQLRSIHDNSSQEQMTQVGLTGDTSWGTEFSMLRGMRPIFHTSLDNT